MKGIITGFEPVDYKSKKTGEPVKGAQIYFNCKSSNAFGVVGKSEYIAEKSPLYIRVIAPLLEKFYDESSDVYGGTIEIDHDVTKRAGMTFTEVVDLKITLKQPEKSEKKAG